MLQFQFLGIRRCVIWWIFTDVSEHRIACICRVKQGQAGNDSRCTVAYGQALKFGGMLDLEDERIKLLWKAVISLDVTTPQTEKLHCSTALRRLWQSQDACPCPALPCPALPCPVSHQTLHSVYYYSTLLVTQYARICFLQVILYVKVFLPAQSVYRCQESRVEGLNVRYMRYMAVT